MIKSYKWDNIRQIQQLTAWTTPAVVDSTEVMIGTKFLTSWPTPKKREHHGIICRASEQISFLQLILIHTEPTLQHWSSARKEASNPELWTVNTHGQYKTRRPQCVMGGSSTGAERTFSPFVNPPVGFPHWTTESQAEPSCRPHSTCPALLTARRAPPRDRQQWC